MLNGRIEQKRTEKIAGGARFPLLIIFSKIIARKKLKATQMVVEIKLDK